MKVAKNDGVKLLVALGIKNAASMNADKLAEKLEAMDATKAQLGKMDKGLANLYKAIKAAVEKEQDIVVTAGKEESKKAKAKAKDEDDEEDEDEDEEEGEESEEDEEEEDDEDAEDSDDDEDEEESDEEESEDEEESDDDEDEESDDEDEDEEEEDVKDKKKNKKGKKDKGDKPKKKKEGAAKDLFGHRLGTRTSRIDSAITTKFRTVKEIEKAAKAVSINSHLSRLIANGFIEKGKTKEGKIGFRLNMKNEVSRKMAKQNAKE